MTAFVWRDGERTIRFGPGAAAHAWPGADVLTTARAEKDIPAAVLAGARVHHVPAGQVPDAAAALIGRVGDGRMVAWGGGRVIDTAKALAAARGGEVCAVATTLSGAEMSRGHRPAPGYEGRPNHRPVLVLAEPALMAGQPAEARRASAMNALAHAAEALYGPGRNPVASMAAARAAALLARGVEAGDRDDLALGALLAGYALGSAGFSLHHVLCQTVVRTCGTSAFDDERRRAAVCARGDGGARAGGDRRARRRARRRAGRSRGAGLGTRRRPTPERRGAWARPICPRWPRPRSSAPSWPRSSPPPGRDASLVEILRGGRLSPTP